MSGNDNTHIIPDGDKTKMQAHAVSAPASKPEKAVPAKKPAAPKTAAPKPVAAAPQPKVDPTPSLVRMAIGVIITLDLTNVEFFAQHGDSLKSGLAKVKNPNGEDLHNLFNPFRAVTAKARAKDPTAARGVLRNAMNAVFDVASELEGQNITFLGKRSDVAKMLNSTADSLQIRVQNAIGFNPTDVVATLVEPIEATENNPAVEGKYMHFGDVVSVSSWANTTVPTLDLAENTDNGITTNLFVNIRVNAASLYSAEELDNAITQIKNYLLQVMEKYGDAPLTLLALNLRPNALSDRRFIDAMVFINEDNWDLYDRQELIENAKAGSIDWTPNADQIDTKLLANGGDIFCLTLLTNDEVEEESSEEETD